MPNGFQAHDFRIGCVPPRGESPSINRNACCTSPGQSNLLSLNDTRPVPASTHLPTSIHCSPEHSKLARDHASSRFRTSGIIPKSSVCRTFLALPRSLVSAGFSRFRSRCRALHIFLPKFELREGMRTFTPHCPIYRWTLSLRVPTRTTDNTEVMCSLAPRLL